MTSVGRSALPLKLQIVRRGEALQELSLKHHQAVLQDGEQRVWYFHGRQESLYAYSSSRRDSHPRSSYSLLFDVVPRVLRALLMARYNPLHIFSNATWLYPFKGFLYFTTRREFWPLFNGRLIPITLLSTFILVNLFIWTYLPQVAFLALFHGPVAWLNATFLVLGEGAAVVAILFETFFVDETLVDVFDAVLIKEGLGDMVAEARLLDDDAPNAVKMLGKPKLSAVYSPFSFRQIIEFIVLLPLNLIPVAGVPLFLVLTGYRAGPFHHWRYFKFLGFSKKERKDYVKRRQMKYTGFGIAALGLQLVPVLSMFFLLTTAAGSALWAAKMENARRARDAMTESVPEPYSDQPA